MTCCGGKAVKDDNKDEFQDDENYSCSTIQSRMLENDARAREMVAI